MENLENVKNLELNFNLENLKQSVNALLLKTKAWANVSNREKKEVYDTRLSMMNNTSNVMDNKSMNLRETNADRHARYRECLDNMPTLQRAAFHMKTFENYSTDFICKDLEISEELFWSLINKSRNELINALELK